MNQTVERPTVGTSRGAASDGGGFMQSALLAVLIGLLYYRVLAGLVGQWWRDANYSYAFFVPVFAGLIIWKQRSRLTKEPARPKGAGLIIVAGALGELILGVVGAENFLSRTSLLFLLAGLIIYFRGWRFFRTMLFPWAVLFLMIPLPTIVFNQIALSLQFQASRLAGSLLALVGVPILREGNVIRLPSLTLNVVEACSGLRSLASLVALAIFYGYRFEPRISRRMVLILSAVPIAVLANGVRIMGSGILGQYWSTEMAEGFFHLFSGWLIFLVSLGLLAAFHKAVSWVDRWTLARNA